MKPVPSIYSRFFIPTLFVVAIAFLLFSCRGCYQYGLRRDVLPASFDEVKWKSDNNSKLDSLIKIRHRDSLMLHRSIKPKPGATTIVNRKKIIERIKATSEKIDALKGDPALLGFSHPLVLKRKDVGNINVFVKIGAENLEMKQVIEDQVKKQQVYSKTKDTIEIYPENVVVYKKLQISLIDPESSFAITRIHDSDTQTINKINGNRWYWTILTNSEKERVLLILKVVAEQPDGAQVPFQDRQIPIVIEIDNSGVGRSIWIYLIDHPEYILGAILLPVLGYFAKKIFDRKKKDDS